MCMVSEGLRVDLRQQIVTSGMQMHTVKNANCMLLNEPQTFLFSKIIFTQLRMQFC